ncbi:serine hydrolase domain-containing protein [Embleya hyalina]|uniref:Serine hydrolase n=1 Tax=Embleya hyalina TaxID=516124 RepID=A0A401YT66_9ACTN|nr:serine hydrolase domain-containing protein [Embleya hyalina]GCD97769.1 serine hydrolase [Embleya hyalina]
MSTRTVFRNLTCAVAASLCLAVAVPVAAADELDVASGPSASAPTRPDEVAWGQALGALTEAKAVSAIAAVRDAEGTRRAGVGVSDRTTGAPVRADGRFRIGSVTKTFVATTVLQLVGEGRLGLNDPVARHLPGLLPKVAGKDSTITVGQLLKHTSGLWDPTNEPGGLFPDIDSPEAFRAWVAQGGLVRTYTPRQIVVAAVGDPNVPGSGHAPYFEPGAGWAYSNTNYVLAGMLIEKITGRTYAQEIDRRILRPLGMRQTSFPGTSTRIPGIHAHSYWYLSPNEAMDVTRTNPSWGGAAGEMISTTDDLLRFHRALLAGRLLRPAQMREMRDAVPTSTTPDALRYGVGLARLQLSCTVVWGHNGGIFGYSTQLWGNSDRQLALSYTPFGTDRDQEAQAAADTALIEKVFCGK